LTYKSQYICETLREATPSMYIWWHKHTIAIPSLAERATMSAHDTVKGHSFSTAALMVFTYLKFLIPKLLTDFCSDTTPRTVVKSRDASHDCIYMHHYKLPLNLKRYNFVMIMMYLYVFILTLTIQSWKRFRTHDMAVFPCWLYSSVTCCLIISSAFGQLLE